MVEGAAAGGVVDARIEIALNTLENPHGHWREEFRTVIPAFSDP